MKILYHFRTRGTGAEAVHISGIATAFEKLGHEVVFSSPTGVDPRQSAGASPFKNNPNDGVLSRLARRCPGWMFELMEMGYNASAWWRNRRLISSGGFDMVYERHAFFLFATAALAASRKIPMVVEVNELAGDERVREQPAFRRIVRWCDHFTLSRATSVIVVSPHLKRRIEALGIDGGKIRVLPNAVDAAHHRHLVDGSDMRRRWGVSPADVVIGFVGWFVDWHKLDMLMDVFANISRKYPSAQLVLVGEGPIEPALRTQAARLGLLEKVGFVGVASHSEMPRYIAAMDVCVVPNSNEYRSPIKLFEYMAQARAVVAPRTEPVEMVVKHAENGLLFEAGSRESMQAALESFVEDAVLRARVGSNARGSVLAAHTWDHNARKVLRAVGSKAGSIERVNAE